MVSLAFALLLAAASPEAAPPVQAAAPAAPPAAAQEPAKKKHSLSDVICQDVTPLGTRFSKRVCTSRADLEERSRRDQDFIRTMRTAPTPNN